MTRADALHEQAMAAVDAALAARRQGEVVQAHNHFLEALRLEEEAARELFARPDAEPSRAVLYRSAATLALDVGDWRRAERLAAVGLGGFPPDVIAQELRSVMETATSRYHLEARGMRLTSASLQLSVWGGEVAPGFAPGMPLVRRVEIGTGMLERARERLQGDPYRTRGKAPRSPMEPFISVPRAASVAVTIALGEQDTLPLGAATLEPTIDDVALCLELYRDRRFEELRRHIGDDAYYRNFKAAADELSPDGKRIGGVGITVTGVNAGERHIRLPPRFRGERRQRTAAGQEEVTVTGVLDEAKGRQADKHIGVYTDEGTAVRFFVPEGLGEIVKRHFEERVTATGIRRGRLLELESLLAEE